VHLGGGDASCQMNLTGITLYRAMLYDDAGEHVTTVKFKRNDKTFTHKKRTYNIMLDKATQFTEENLLFEKRFFQYNINNPNPFLLNKKAEPIVDAEVYKIQLETKILKDLNDLSKGGLAALLTPRNIIIGLIVIGVLVYLSTGHKLVNN
jgi:hypothetical protein